MADQESLLASVLVHHSSGKLILISGHWWIMSLFSYPLPVPLVKQQANYIRAHTDLEVSPFYGELNVDSWDKHDWYDKFNRNKVLVMSCQIFLDMLNRAVIKPRQINLLIFDECHHATKNHPYRQIMKVIGDAPHEDRPRVLGLSASLLAKKVKMKAGELEKGVRDLETALMSTARTSQDLKEVAKYATQPEEDILYYSCMVDEKTEILKRLIDKPLEFVHNKVPGRRHSRLGELAKNLLDDLQSILLDLGPASAAEFVEQALDELRRGMAVDEDDRWDYMQGCLAMTHLAIFSTQCKKFTEREEGTHVLGDGPKVLTLLQTLADDGVRTGESNSTQDSPPQFPPRPPQADSKKPERRLRGIIFVERRYTASCLAKLLQKKSRKDPELRHIKCDYVIGHAAVQGPSYLKKDTRMKSKHQEEVLTKFRKGRINLLVATSVIEEGVDVPRCNLVVRFDLPQNFRAYIQSKGRARDKPSRFLLMVNDAQSDKTEMIRTFNKLEGELVQLCQEKRAMPTEEAIQIAKESLVPPYMPYGLEGARATLGNSLSLLHR